MIIKSATVFASGDRSVGIPSVEYRVECWIDLGCVAIQDGPKLLGDIRQKLKEAYEIMVGEPVEVLFDFEAENKWVDSQP